MKSSGKKVLVAYRTLPGDAYSALVVPTENMPDEMHNAIINLVESPAAQESYEFAEALDRTQFPNGSRMLPALHVQQRLIKVGTDQVEMTPVIGATILLSELNQIIAEQRGVAVDDLHIKPGSNDKAKVVEVATVKEVPTESAPEITTSNTVEDQAKHFRSQADKLAKQAAEFRRKAEELVPTKKTK
jgi:dihydroxyacetone kinase-like predicted kinase